MIEFRFHSTSIFACGMLFTLGGYRSTGMTLKNAEYLKITDEVLENTQKKKKKKQGELDFD